MMNKLKNLSRPIIALFVIAISIIITPVSSDVITFGPDTPHDNTPDGSAVNEAPPDRNESNIHTPPVVIDDTRGEFRAVWVASVLNLDFPTRPGLSAAAVKREIDAIVTTTSNMGLNTIILQVRPTGDAFYESDIFPWSNWLSGEQGTGIPDFDPLAYWLEKCHENNIELHAWLNPYRIIHTSTNTSDVETLSENNPVRLNPELAVAWTTGSGNSGRTGLFLDPGLPEARQLIIDGIIEIITKYDVDGIHFDDYFYPGRDFDDAFSYNLYGGDIPLDDWRRENVNELIRDIQSVIREHNAANGRNIRWGISPFAIWKNGSNDPLGIPTTAGQESYHAHYADTRRWVMEEWVDYICPQIYWYIGYNIADFEAIYNWWSDLCADSSVDLYVGHAVYRESEDTDPDTWRGEIIRQLEMMASSESSQGSAFYRYFSMRSSVGRSITDYYAQTGFFPVREPVLLCDTLSVGFPVSDATITGNASNISGHNIIGTSLPDLPLYLNGEEIATRTEEGFFHVFAPLDSGDNVFTFTQNGVEDVTLVITLRAPASGDIQTPPEITQVTTQEYATVTTNDAWVYSNNTTRSNTGYMLTQGSRDRIVAKSESNNFIQLSCGAWVRTDAVTIQQGGEERLNNLRDGTYRIEQDYDVITWVADIFPAAITHFDGEKLTISFGLHTQVPELTLPDDLEGTLFESYRSGTQDGVPFYEFILKEDVKFEGCIIEYAEGEFQLFLKKRKTLSAGTEPLTGITIILDAGHGGEANGAIGPFGYDLPEKDIVLMQAQNLAESLRSLGAEVILTREDDSDVTLQDRVNLSREIIPDLFISLHTDSIPETTNALGVRGFTVWHFGANSKNFAETALDVLHFINPGTNRQKFIRNDNFVVCRPWWSPHVIFESSFVSNIYDFVWLLDPVQQERYTDAAVDAVLDYFS